MVKLTLVDNVREFFFSKKEAVAEEKTALLAKARLLADRQRTLELEAIKYPVSTKSNKNKKGVK